MRLPRPSANLSKHTSWVALISKLMTNLADSWNQVTKKNSSNKLSYQMTFQFLLLSYSVRPTPSCCSGCKDRRISNNGLKPSEGLTKIIVISKMSVRLSFYSPECRRLQRMPLYIHFINGLKEVYRISWRIMHLLPMTMYWNKIMQLPTDSLKMEERRRKTVKSNRNRKL